MQRLRLISLVNKLVLLLIPCLIFSYLPVIVLGKTAGLSIELSFLYVLTGTTVILGLLMTRTRELRPLLHRAPWILLGSFITYLFVSLLWTSNPVRGIITSLFFAMLFGLVTLFAHKLPFLKSNWSIIRKSLLSALIIISAWGLWQMTGDALQLPYALTGLSMMYSGEVFGVARPTAFALEPQFLGSLLIIPLLWSLYHLLATPPQRFVPFVYFIATLMLLMTLSRGAIIAAVIGGILILLVVRPVFRRVLRVIGLTTASTIGFMLLVFCFASLRNDAISGTDAVQRVISQLSLGVVSAQPSRSHPSLPEESPTSSQTNQSSSSPNGYIAESTDSRITMSKYALALWHQSPTTVLFGVGIGGFGTSVHAVDPNFSVSSVVNNYYLELLVETGLFGILLFGGFILSLLIALLRRRAFLPAIILLALLTQAAFFSGNANIIHIWAFVGICLGVAAARQKSARPSSRLLQ